MSMKIGIIGFGSIGKRHFENVSLLPDVSVVVFSQRTDLHGIESVSTWEDFAVKGPFDAFFITNETAKHVDTIGCCLKLNPKALLIEKPLSHNMEKLAEIAGNLKQKQISAWVAYNFLFFEPFLRIKKILHEKVLGKIYYLRVSVGQDLSKWRARDYSKCYSSSKAGGGGVMLDLVHEINYPAWLLEEKLVARTCYLNKISDLNIDTEDCAESVLTSESGVIVSIHQDYVRTPYGRFLEIAGERGTLTWDSDDNAIKIKDNSGIVLSEKIELERNVMYKDEIDFFIDSVKNGIYFSNIDEAIQDVKLIEELKKYAGK